MYDMICTRVCWVKRELFMGGKNVIQLHFVFVSSTSMVLPGALFVVLETVYLLTLDGGFRFRLVSVCLYAAALEVCWPVYVHVLVLFIRHCYTLL